MAGEIFAARRRERVPAKSRVRRAHHESISCMFFPVRSAHPAMIRLKIFVILSTKNIHMEPLGGIGSQPGLKWFDKGKLYRKAEGSKLPVYGH